MPPTHPKLPAPPQPTRVFFDPFNSSSTGHQRAENRLSGSTSWRDSRSYKLKNQFKDVTGGGGRKHLSDLVGAGSEHFGKDGRKENGDWEVGAPGLRGEGWQDIRGLLGPRKRRSEDEYGDGRWGSKKKRISEGDVGSSQGNEACDMTSALKVEGAYDLTQGPEAEDISAEPVCVSVAKVRSTASLPMNSTVDDKVDEPEQPPQIFRGLTMYLNGSTMPLVSDHQLKRLFAQHGGNSSISLGRRTVTHVILGERCGGGLASGKIQKENTTIRGKGIKFVSAKWVLDSVEKGIRQPEHKYAASEIKGRLGGSRQQSVAGLFRAKSA